MDETSDHSSLISEAMQQFHDEHGALRPVNILIAGKTGVGKSTLVNAVFGDELARTGAGKPVSHEIKLIEKDGVPVHIYDTVGFELSWIAQRKAAYSINRLIKRTGKTPNPDDDIHCLWYCVSAPGHRMENMEINFVKGIKKRGIPVIVVMTQVNYPAEADELWDSVRSRLPEVDAMVETLALAKGQAKAFGIDTLINETYAVLPDSAQSAFANAQKASLEVKRKQASKAVNASVASTFGVGFVPIPIADAPMMLTMQSGMLAKITNIYGVDVSKQRVETLLAGVMGMLGAMTGGKAAASALFKMVPGVGTLAGGMISGGVGGAMTYALGHAYMQLMEMALDGRVNLDDVVPDEVTNLLVTLIQQSMPNIPDWHKK